MGILNPSPDDFNSASVVPIPPSDTQSTNGSGGESSSSSSSVVTPPSSPSSSSQSSLEEATTRPPPIEATADTMATMAMSDNMTIGMEQVIVSLSLLVISLYCLAKPTSKLRLRQFIQYILCGGRFRHKRFDDFVKKKNDATNNNNRNRNRNSKNKNNNDKNGVTENDNDCDEEVRLIGTMNTNTNNATTTPTTNSNVLTDSTNNNKNQQSQLHSNPQQQQQQQQQNHAHVRFLSTPSPPPLSTTTINSPKQARTMSPLRKSKSIPRSLGIGDWPMAKDNTSILHPLQSSFQPQQAPPQNQQPQQHHHHNDDTNTTAPKDLEHEHFLQTYETHIKTSNHRKLVLPPQCRLIDPIKMRMAQKKNETRKQLYHILDTIKRVWTYDYMGTTVHFNYRIWMALGTRWYKTMRWSIGGDDDMTVDNENEEGEKVEEDDDDQTVESCISHHDDIGSSSSSAFNSTGATKPQEQRDRFYSGGGVEDFKDSSSSAGWEDENSIPPQQLQQQQDGSSPLPQRPMHTYLTRSQQSSSVSVLSELSMGRGGAMEEMPVLDLKASSVKYDTTTTSADHTTISVSPLHCGLPPPQTPKRHVFTNMQNTNKLKAKDQLEKYRRGGVGGGGVHHIPNNNNNVTKLPLTVALSPAVNTTPLNHNPKTPIISNIEKFKSKDLIYFDAAANNADQYGYILGDDLLHNKKDTPLLVFVNTRSGSQQGLMLKVQLRRLLNPIQVWDLADGGPEKVLESFLVFTHLRLLVCGGDGTVSWIVSALDKMKIEKWPPIAILPLGTGNDLARIHGWGGGYANESLLLILNQVQEAYISLLDRWKLTMESKNKKREVKAFTNYMSIGMDAFTALQVHNLRGNSPKLFFSRAVNKFWYALFGADDYIKGSCSDLPRQVILKADGIEVPIPEDSQGLIVLNIDSYLGGVPLWDRGTPPVQDTKSYQRLGLGRRYSESDFSMYESVARTLKKEGAGSFDATDSVTGDDNNRDGIQSIAGKFPSRATSCPDGDEMEKKEELARVTACDMPSSCQDGRLDIVSIRSNLHLGQIRVGLSNAQLLCQCSKLKMTLKKKTVIQIDGEPWEQDKGTLRFAKKKTSAIMLHKATEEGGGVETEVAKLLDWAAEKEIINHNAHGTLMQEFSRRIESKTRARRVKSQRNVFSTMTRAIASQNNLSNFTSENYNS